MSGYYARQRLPTPTAASFNLQDNVVELLGFGVIGRLNATQQIRAGSFEISGFLNVTLQNSHSLILVAHNINTALADVKRGYVSIANSSRGGTSIFEFRTSYNRTTQTLTIYVKDALGQTVTLAPGTYRIQINFYSVLNTNGREEFCFPCPPCHQISRC